ncbi:hypothetical protein Tco_0041825 [Tanacetum coccineum]
MLWSWILMIRGFSVGGTGMSMSIREFILELGLYTEEEMNNNLFGLFRDACFRNRPNNYNLIDYCIGITTRNHYDSHHPPYYTTIKNPIRHLVHRLLTLSVAGRHNAKEKVTLQDLFFLHSMDGGEMVDVPWNVAKFLSDKAKGYKKKIMIVGAHFIGRIAWSYGLMSPAYMMIVTLGQETLLLNTTKLVDLDICKFNALGMGELVYDRFDNNKDEAVAAEARRIGEENEGGVSHHPNMSFTNKLGAIDDRLHYIDTNIYKLSNDVEGVATEVLHL